MAPDHDRSCTGHRGTHEAEVAHRICRRDSGREAVGSPPSAGHDVVGHSARREDRHSSHAAEESYDGSHRDAGYTHEAGLDGHNSSHPAEGVRDHDLDSQATEIDSAHAGAGCQFAADVKLVIRSHIEMWRVAAVSRESYIRDTANRGAFKIAVVKLFNGSSKISSGLIFDKAGDHQPLK